MAEKRKCPMSTYPTDCKDRCTECECGGKGMTHGLICKDKLLDKLEDMYLNTGLSGNSNYSNGVADEYEQVVDAICNMPPAADVQSVYCAENVQNEVLNYLFNKEREAESMSYGDKRQERIATIREIIRFVEDIDPRMDGDAE